MYICTCNSPSPLGNVVLLFVYLTDKFDLKIVRTSYKLLHVECDLNDSATGKIVDLENILS